MHPIKKKNSQRRSFFLFAGALLFLIILWPDAKSHATEAENTVTLNAEVDTYVAIGQPAGINYSDKNLFYVGYWDKDGLNSRRSLLQFNIEASPPITSTTTINSAKLTLSIGATSTETDPINIQTKRITTTWTSGINWNEMLNLPLASRPSPNPVVKSAPDSGGLDQLEWDVTTLLQDWVTDNLDSDVPFSLLLSATEEIPNRFRGFVSSDCTLDLCKGNRPKLEIEYEDPPTVEPTAPSADTTTPEQTDMPEPLGTATPIPPTPFPTPGLQSIKLSSDPEGELAPGDTVTYTIEIKNGTYPLTSATISNTIPNEVEVLLSTAPTATVTSSVINTTTNQFINWHLGFMPPEATRVVSYQAIRPTPIPTTAPILSGLHISKSAPDYAVVRTQFIYALTVTNYTTGTLTNIVITDTIPANVVLTDISEGTAVLPPVTSSAQIVWPYPSTDTITLDAGESTTVEFSVFVMTDTEPIENKQYSATAMGVEGKKIHSQADQPTIQTNIVTSGNLIPPRNIFWVRNKQACARWVITPAEPDDANGTLCTSNEVTNPDTMTQYFPFITISK